MQLYLSNKIFFIQQLALDNFETPEARAEGIFKRMDINSGDKKK